ncbi:hypothetical protein [Phyllobacterium sp. P5_D12]
MPGEEHDLKNVSADKGDCAIRPFIPATRDYFVSLWNSWVIFTGNIDQIF